MSLTPLEQSVVTALLADYGTRRTGLKRLRAADALGMTLITLMTHADAIRAKGYSLESGMLCGAYTPGRPSKPPPEPKPCRERISRPPKPEKPPKPPKFIKPPRDKPVRLERIKRPKQVQNLPRGNMPQPLTLEPQIMLETITRRPDVSLLELSYVHGLSDDATLRAVQQLEARGCITRTGNGVYDDPYRFTRVAPDSSRRSQL